jgi:GABA(A) receptor-associated protein
MLKSPQYIDASDYIKEFVRLPLAQRQEVSRRIRDKYPERIPTIVGRLNRSNIGPINKHKFLVPRDITVGALIVQIRKHVTVRPDESLFLIFGDMVPLSTATLGEMDKKYANEDGFLYIIYAGESVFGSV